MKKLFLTVLTLALCSSLFAQTWRHAKDNPDLYLFGEGKGVTIYEADNHALQQIISQLCVHVSSQIELTKEETRTGDQYEHKRYIDQKIATYSNATLTNTEMYVISNEPDAHVARWISKSELNRIFAGRKAKVQEYMSNALKGEEKGKLDDALRNYYWAYTLLMTLQHPSEVTFVDNNYQNHVLITWIPEKMNNIFDDIRVSVTGRQNDDIELFFTYQGKPVTSLDYTYFDGGTWSNLYSVKDGKGLLELAPGALGENLHLKVEFAYMNQAHIDREIASVISVVKSVPFPKAYLNSKGAVDNNAQKALSGFDASVNADVARSLQKVADDRAVKASMNQIINAISQKRYDDVQKHFTPDGLDMFTRLISYGNAKIIGTPSYSVYQNSDRIIVRSIPMSFSFKNGTTKFVEDVVFTFNTDGKIESLAFSLDDTATRDVLTKQAWPEHARMAIVEFLENYKTAFALERLDYIRTIFDENAVIIVGKLAKAATAVSPEQQLTYNNNIIVRTRLTKEQYLRNLERCFASNEFVNIRFANNDIIKAGKGGEIYGIQIKQDYYSANYGDTGYLFLLVDLNDPQAPMIKVRTWQPEPDPIDGLYDITHF